MHFDLNLIKIKKQIKLKTFKDFKAIIKCTFILNI